MQAEEADDVRAVGMEVLASVRPVEANARVDPGDPLVADVGADIGLAILANWSAELQTETHIGRLDLGRCQRFDREPSKQQESAPLIERVGPGANLIAEAGEGDILPSERRDRAAVGSGQPGGVDDLVPLDIAQRHCPAVTVADVARSPHRRSVDARVRSHSLRRSPGPDEGVGDGRTAVCLAGRELFATEVRSVGTVR
ncbi:MAG TPA: hypothetical protein VII96_08065 [Acidimicrobiales bacterium]